ncbi:hypothetical protein ACLMJK_002220 [Lecanora helva]
MLSSLPPLLPHDPHTLWYPSLITHPPPFSNSNPDPNLPPNHSQQHHHQNAPHHQQRPNPSQRTPLSTLRADELALQMRKANIRRFGAGWLRPPGVGKTLQGIADERAEREELESARTREFAMAETEQLQAEIRDETDRLTALIREQGEQGGGGVGGEGEERDLDDEVPDADADGDGDGDLEGWSDVEEAPDLESEVDDGEGAGVMGEVERQWVGHVAGAFAGLTGEGVVDLDDEVPEAEEGSYEHTDTEVEDEDSSEDDGGVMRQGPVLGTFDRRTGEVVRVSGGGASGVLGNSVFGSSPIQMREAAGRNVGRGRGRGGREN